MAENISREFIELLLNKVDLVDLINIQIPLRKKSGSNYFARCPFHNEKSASFSVSQPKQFYYCFGCGAHGNAIDFLMQHERMAFPEAVEALARHAGMEVPRNTSTQQKVESLSALFELTSLTAQYYYEQMRKSPRAIDYLKTRNISGAIARQFQIGFAPGGWDNVLDYLGKTAEDKKRLLETGVIIKKPEGGFYDRFRDRIMFPIHDYRGRIIGFGGRVIDQGEPKYLNSPETALFQKGHELYGLYQALKINRKLERVLIVEGYMDVIALFQHDITYAAATLGTATTEHHIKRLSRYTSDIIFCFDGDNAGRAAAWRALQVIFPLMDDRLQVRFLFLPEGEDPDSMVHKEGKAAFETHITTAISFSTFFFQTLSLQSDMGTMEGRARFAALALEQIKQLPATIFQKMLLDELAKRARVNINDLHVGLKKKTLPIVDPAMTARACKFAPPVKLAMTLLIQYPHFITDIAELMPANNLPGYDFFLELINLIQQKPHLKAGTLIEYWRGEKGDEFFTKMEEWQHNFSEENAKNEFLGAIRKLNLMWLEEEINRLLAKASMEALSSHEKSQLSNWISKKQQYKQMVSAGGEHK